jgi:DNA-binding response OmpR family regulator
MQTDDQFLESWRLDSQSTPGSPLVIPVEDFARLMGIAERAVPPGISELRRGLFHMYMHQASYDGRQLDITRASFCMLRRLLIAPQNAVVTYRELFDSYAPRPGLSTGRNINGCQSGLQSNVRSAIKRTRIAMAAAGMPPGAIESVSGVGYRWGLT